MKDRARERRALGRLALGVALLVSTRADPARAHARGIAVDSCSGCHGGGATAPSTVALTADPASFGPGDAVTFTLRVTSPSIRVGGAYIRSGGVGTLQALGGEGLSLNGQALSHSAPKAAADGAVTFRFAWRAPMAPGAVSFDVAALAGNGNGASSGDSPGGGSFQWVFGCTGRTSFLDLDRDGYGSKTLGTRLSCEDAPTPAGYAAMDGDCDENNEQAHPGATEVCNRKDDDCNGDVDEGAEPVMLWPDADGDGFYKEQSGEPKVGCGNVPGYAASGGDCDDLEAAIHPGAAEICNGRDDDCDGDGDEQVRPQCGTGWCARYSTTCDAADCKPGSPAAESCNEFDDDCDGVIDNDACASGLLCVNRQCVTAADAGERPGGSGPIVMPPPSSSPSSPPSPPRDESPPENKSPEAGGCASFGATPNRLAPAWILAALLAFASVRSRHRRGAPRPR